jgi:hypothetical protein
LDEIIIYYSYSYEKVHIFFISNNSVHIRNTFNYITKELNNIIFNAIFINMKMSVNSNINYNYKIFLTSIITIITCLKLFTTMQ